ncbi:MAG: heme lyase CcmF/NrfE family subunit [Gammaproteobacteria bacterium]|jgi:cytochrome c-type biogenesis protein CcmF
MIPELGQFALILALCFAVLQIYPARSTRLMCIAQFIFILFSFLILEYAFIQNDFSVTYVAAHSHTDLPLMYRISAVWGGHEGSLLLWVLMLSGWGAAVAVLGRHLPERTHAILLSVLGVLSVGFLVFIIFTSNPFLRALPIAPFNGQDLNPLLQDPALIIHPPLLYMGYVGFSVAFAFAITALITGKLDPQWARWMRPWTLIAWMFLTLGIVVGSWWAYYVLGWGGWWFWDPVENASFMPWLLGCALIHSLAVVEKRHTFKRWTILLAIFTFSLCLLGTFLVRSGILTSVHAFANDPERGLYILLFLSVVIASSLVLYIFRSPQMKSTAGFDYLSRETFLLTNNALLVIACATVLLGTLYPLFLEIFTGNKISVGPPYYSSVFVPLMVILIIFMGFGPASQYKTSNYRELLQHLLIPFLLAFGLSLFMPFGIMLTIGLAAWLIFSLLENIITRFRTITASEAGMYCAHFGVAILLLGVGLSKQLEVEQDVYMKLGDTATAGPYEFTLSALNKGVGPNYTTTIATIDAYHQKKYVTHLHPEKRVYNVSQIAQSQTDIDPGFTRDLYVALGEQLGEQEWSVRIYYKPFIRFIWLGGLFIALGALIGVCDKRYRIKKES